MGKGYEKSAQTRLGEALRVFCRKHGKGGRGAQAWLVEKTGKPSGMINKWWKGALKDLPADVAFEEAMVGLSFDPEGVADLRRSWNEDRGDQSQRRRAERLHRAIAHPSADSDMTAELIDLIRNLDEQDRRVVADLVRTLQPMGLATWGQRAIGWLEGKRDE